MHSGEVAIARRLAVEFDPYYTMSHPSMPMQHQVFFSELPYFVFGNLDAKGRPWVTLFTGKRGFITAKNENRLDVNVEHNKWDPVVRNLQKSTRMEDGTELFAGLGVDFSNRRRNKVAGRILGNSIKVATENGNERAKVEMQIRTTESLGNCPKYITLRSVKYDQRNNPQLVHNFYDTTPPALPQECIDTVHQADTLFVSTRHFANKEDLEPTTSMDANIRGGNKGFIRVTPDGKRIVWPDYSGNRLYQSLGNIESDHLAGLVFPNFATGDLLFVTGDAENLIGEKAQEVMQSTNVVIQVTITGFVFIRHGLDLILQNEKVGYSPYNPPLRFLRSESALDPHPVSAQSAPLTLTSITPITKNIATFTFSLPPDHATTYLPGQHILVDFSSVMDKPYMHMNENRPQLLNDDLIRSWTISSSPAPPFLPATPCAPPTLSPTTSLSCTIKLKEQGLITPLLYRYADIPAPRRPPLHLRTRGVNGSFTPFSLATSPSDPSPIQLENKKMLFIAGGIGVTPFLSFHSAIQSFGLDADLAILFSCRGHEIALASPFITPPLHSTPKIRLFQTGDAVGFAEPVEQRRMTKDDVAAVEGLRERVAYVCGPDAFMSTVVEWLQQLGLPPDQIRQEKFNF